MNMETRSDRIGDAIVLLMALVGLVWFIVERMAQ
jgi:hypothetical protein